MARPPSTNPATEIVRVRVTPKQKAKLVRLAKAAGLTLSEYLRSRGLRA